MTGSYPNNFTTMLRIRNALLQPMTMRLWSTLLLTLYLRLTTFKEMQFLKRTLRLHCLSTVGVRLGFPAATASLMYSCWILFAWVRNLLGETRQPLARTPANHFTSSFSIACAFTGRPCVLRKRRRPLFLSSLGFLIPACLSHSYRPCFDDLFHSRSLRS